MIHHLHLYKGYLTFVDEKLEVIEYIYFILHNIFKFDLKFKFLILNIINIKLFLISSVGLGLDFFPDSHPNLNQ